MNVGIISNEPHAKSHAKELTKLGHTVSLLGGRPSVVPPSVDVIVCRPASCSHHGFDVAMAEKRAGRRVIIANGVVEVVDAVQLLDPKQKKKAQEPESAPAHVRAPHVLSATEWIDKMLAGLGIYGPLLHRDAAEDAVTWLAKRGRSEEQAAVLVQEWREYLKIHKTGLDRISRCLREDVLAPEPPRWKKLTGYYVPPKGPVYLSTFAFTDSSLAADVFKLINTFETQEAAQAAMELKMKRPAKPAPVPAAEPVVEPMVEPVAVEPVAVEPLAPVRVEPVVPARAVVDVPTPAATRVILEAGAKKKAPLPWDASLRSALALVLAEMKATRVIALTVNQEGKVLYQREELVVVVKDGDMIVSPED